LLFGTNKEGPHRSLHCFWFNYLYDPMTKYTFFNILLT